MKEWISQNWNLIPVIIAVLWLSYKVGQLQERVDALDPEKAEQRRKGLKYSEMDEPKI